MKQNKKNPSLPKASFSPLVAPQGLYPFSRIDWMELFCAQRFDLLEEEFLKVLDSLREYTLVEVSKEILDYFNEFTESFLYFFTHPSYTISAKNLKFFIFYQPLIANIAAISDFKSTTPWVVGLSRHRESFFKLLVLNNIRTEVELESSILFDVSEPLASQWWAFYWFSAPAFCTEGTYTRIKNHLHAIDNRFILFGSAARSSYFPVTYIEHDSEGVCKGVINRLAQKSFENITITNHPDPKKLALISNRWHRSAVYTSVAPFIHSLKGHYDITLITYGDNDERILDKDMFGRILTIKMEQNHFDLSVVDNNDFAAVIYPDVGMDTESIFLSNIRLAPIQMAMYGHPSSTRGSCIDYFITGKESEDLSLLQKHYSERPVVLDGFGVYPVIPQFPKDKLEPITPNPGEITINCSWTAQKVTYPLLKILRHVIDRSDNKNIVFQFFSGKSKLEYIPFVKDVTEILGIAHSRVFPVMSNLLYLSYMNTGTFSIDSYPFGGFNSVIDSLHLQIPVVSWQSDIAAGRFSTATLNMLGLGELCAHSEEEYCEIILRLIHDTTFLNSTKKKIEAIDLKTTFADHQDPSVFKRAVDHLIANHATRSPQWEPVFIE